MHPQPWRGIDLDDAAALLLERLEYTLAHDVDAANVESDHSRRCDRAGGDLRVHVIRHVGGGAACAQIPVVAQDYAPAPGRHRIGGIALGGETRECDVVELDLRERCCVPVAPARIAIDTLNEIANGVNAIADDLRWIAACRGNQILADHEEAKVVAGKKAFDHDLITEYGRGGVCAQHLLTRVDANGDAFALVSIPWLDHHRTANLARRHPGVLGIRDGAADRDGHPGGVEQLLGQFLVLGDRLRNCARSIGFGSLYTTLAAAPAELDQAAAGQPPVGNPARRCRPDDGAGAGAEAHVLVEPPQTAERACQIEGRVLRGRATQCLCEFQRQPPDRFLRVFDDNVVDARLRRLRRATERHRASRLRLQAEGGELEHVRDGRASRMSSRFEEADFGERRPEPGFEARQIADRALLVAAGYDRLDRGMPAPQVGTAQCADAGYFHRWFSSIARVVRKPNVPAPCLRRRGYRTWPSRADRTSRFRSRSRPGTGRVQRLLPLRQERIQPE